MCAGGGCMYQISNEKFGLFVTELRKKKNLTQKDLAEKLYVSDKTVSKWERGLSMPNVVLLIPIADILDVTVTELLSGEKIDTQKNIDKKEIEELVVGTLDMAVRDSIHQHRKNWILAYLLCFFISITEIIMLVVSDIEYIANNIMLMKDGELFYAGTAEDLVSSMKEKVWQCNVSRSMIDKYMNEYLVGNIKTTKTGAELRIISIEKPTEDAVAVEKNLEDAFLFYFGEKSEEKQDA